MLTFQWKLVNSLFPPPGKNEHTAVVLDASCLLLSSTHHSTAAPTREKRWVRYESQASGRGGGKWWWRLETPACLNYTTLSGRFYFIFSFERHVSILSLPPLNSRPSSNENGWLSLFLRFLPLSISPHALERQTGKLPSVNDCSLGCKPLRRRRSLTPEDELP